MSNPPVIPPAWIPHVVLALVHGLIAAGCGAGAYAFVRGLVEPHGDTGGGLLVAGIAALLASLCLLSALAFLRRIDVLLHRPRLELSPAGIAVRCYQPGWRALFRPRFRRFERTLAWRDFRGCRTEKAAAYEVIPIQQSLILESTGAPLEITWGAFRPGVDSLQREILDYWQLQIVKPAGDDARIPEFLRRLYATPVVFAGPRLGRAEIAGTILAVPVVAAVVCLHLRALGFATALAVAGVLLAVGLTVGALLLRQWIAATRFIRLSTDGIAIGPEERRARLIPWPDLLFARAHALAGSPPSSLTKLELRLHSGETVLIRAFPEAARWARLIDPPADAVRDAWRRIATGVDAATAARAAGLPLPE